MPPRSVLVGEPGPQALVEGDHGGEQALERGFAGVGELDAVHPSLLRITVPRHEADRLQPVEMVGQRRPFDPDGLGQLPLGAVALPLQGREDQPGG